MVVQRPMFDVSVAPGGRSVYSGVWTSTSVEFYNGSGAWLMGAKPLQQLAFRETRKDKFKPLYNSISMVSLFLGEKKLIIKHQAVFSCLLTQLEQLKSTVTLPVKVAPQTLHSSSVTWMTAVSPHFTFSR